MDKYVKIDGGYGRCIAATGAVEIFAKTEKEKGNNVYVVTGFPQVFNGMEEIEKIYPFPGTPFIYENGISKGEFFEPEPYNDVAYYKDEKHLATVFNKLLNGKEEYVEPKIIFSENELIQAQMFIENKKKEMGKKIVLLQPWGSTGGIVYKEEGKEQKVMVDESYRSMGTGFVKKLAEKLIEEGYMVILVKAGHQALVAGTIMLTDQTPNGMQPIDIRKMIALIPYVDGIVCCDSFLHHASAALGTPVPTVVLWAGTNSKNLGYEKQVNITSWKKCEYEPNRIPHDRDYYINKNKGSNEFKLEVIDEIIEHLKEGKKNG